MSNEEKNRLERIEKKLDLLLNQKYGASEKPHDETQGTNKKSPVRRQASVKKVDFKTMYRKKGIV